jgi:hypothetical protein
MIWNRIIRKYTKKKPQIRSQKKSQKESIAWRLPFQIVRPCCRLPTHGFMVAPELSALLTRGGLT